MLYAEFAPTAGAPTLTLTSRLQTRSRAVDWSERRPHLAGRLGAALCRRAFELGWIGADRDSRAVHVTAAGHAGFARAFGIEPKKDALEQTPEPSSHVFFLTKLCMKNPSQGPGPR